MQVRIFRKLIYLLMLFFALSQVISCGKKGDLYLPDEQKSSRLFITTWPYSSLT